MAEVSSAFHDEQKAFPPMNNHYRYEEEQQPYFRIPGTNIRVQAIVAASQSWGWSILQIAEEYNLTEAQVEEALEIYQDNRQLINESIAAEQQLEEAAH
jgi:uncharacterized protein (DUF433 family)